MSDGIPCPAGVVAQPPLLARAWVKAWAEIGGGVTIDLNGDLHPWLCADRPHILAASAKAKGLLDHLAETPGLSRAVRIVLRARMAKRKRS